MDDTTALDRMRAVEARFLSLPSGAGPDAVRAGVERLRAQLAEARPREHDEVLTVSIADPCGRSVFVALCRRYGLARYRELGQRRSTVLVLAPRKFHDKTLWPEYLALAAELEKHLADLTERDLPPNSGPLIVSVSSPLVRSPNRVHLK